MASNSYEAPVVLYRSTGLGAPEPSKVLSAVGLAGQQDICGEVSKGEWRLVILAREESCLAHRKGVISGGPQKRSQSRGRYHFGLRSLGGHRALAQCHRTAGEGHRAPQRMALR